LYEAERLRFFCIQIDLFITTYDDVLHCFAVK
jgi:hypothetical protein